MRTHPLAIVSLSSSVLAYASAFVGSAALVYPAIAVALVAVVTGALARREIDRGAGGRRVDGAAADGRSTDAFGGRALATAGLLSGVVFVLLGIALVALARRGAGG